MLEHASCLDDDQRAAIISALAGNRLPMDKMELWALSFLVRPRTADGQYWLPEPSLDAGLVLWPLDICRAAGPQGQTVVCWGGVQPCPRCWRKPSRRDGCNKCGGEGHLSDMGEYEVFTNIDGLVVMDGYGRPVS